jgi:hypothetical protein
MLTPISNIIFMTKMEMLLMCKIYMTYETPFKKIEWGFFLPEIVD